jgi:hypothetical protein
LFVSGCFDFASLGRFRDGGGPADGMAPGDGGACHGQGPSGQWIPWFGLNIARGSAAAAVAPDGKVYVAGGTINGNASTPTMEIFDGKSWVLAPAQLSVGRTALGAASDDRGRIWVVSGKEDSGMLSRNVDVYENGMFSAGPMTVIAHSGLRVVFADGRLYLFDDSMDEVLDLTQPAPAWATVPQRPRPVDLMAAVVRNGAPVVIGDGSPRQLVQTYSAMARGWLSLPSLPSPRQAHGGAVDCTGRLYAVGGQNPTDASILGTVVTLGLNATSWQAAPPLLQARSEPSVVTAADGAIYAIGGSTAAGFTNSVEIFSP